MVEKATRQTRACEHCGNLFEIEEPKAGRGRFCTRSCAARGRRNWRGSEADRFWRKVDRSGDCWIWTGARSTGGAGLFMVARKWLSAHHYAARLAGVLPSDSRAFVEHACGNPLCVRPEHLAVRLQGNETLGSLTARFWAHVNKRGPVPPHCPDLGACWMWEGARGSDAYGELNLCGTFDGIKRMRAHILSWRLHFGETQGLHVCHRCDNPPCVNPEHLFLGTQAENHDDMKRKGRSARGAKHGAARLTEADVLLIRGSTATQQALARRLGVSRQTIGEIRRREIWKHL